MKGTNEFITALCSSLKGKPSITIKLYLWTSEISSHSKQL
jgi:hypothetical protein